MIGRVGRAEALAAVALVVGARQEPVAALRRLAAEDPALGVLKRVAERLAAGRPLAEALADCRLLPRRIAAGLAAAEPERLATELSRRAQHVAAPPFGEVLAAWFPVWILLVAALPNLAIGGVLALVTGSLHQGIWQPLMLETVDFDVRPLQAQLPGMWWFAQAGAVAALTALTAYAWWLARLLLARHGWSPIAGGLDRAACFADLLARLRAGSPHQRELTAWRRRSGDPQAVEAAVEDAGGDAVAALMALGLIPRLQDGRPDWETAQAEAERQRRRAAAELTPWLLTFIILAGLVGFFAWGQVTVDLIPILGLLYWWNIQAPHLGQPWQAVFGSLAQNLVLITMVTVLAAALLGQLGWLLRSLTGAARDWPLVADRLARAIERREDLDEVLRALHFIVHAPMRRRLHAALASTEALPGRRLAALAPPAQRRLLAAASGAGLAELLRLAAAEPDDHGLGGSLAQAKPVLVLGFLLALLLGYMAWAVVPRFLVMMQVAQQPSDTAIALAWWAQAIAVASVAILVIGSLLGALGRRMGWWQAWAGWRLLARGLALRRLLAGAVPEPAMAMELRRLDPGLPATLEASAARGDLPGVLAAAGWRARDAAGLDRAIAARLLRADRRRARLALAVRLVLPVLLALPIGLSAGSSMLFISQMQFAMVDMARRTAPSPCTGTPGLALIFWWTARCQAQGDAAVEAARPVPQPRPMPKAGR